MVALTRTITTSLTRRVTVTRGIDQQRFRHVGNEARVPSDHNAKRDEFTDAPGIASQRDNDRFSRDMRSEAESSQAPWKKHVLNSSKLDRDEEYENFDRVSTEDVDRPRNGDNHLGRLVDSLSPSWRESQVATGRYFPPRVLKGVHQRRKRAEGSTPTEAAALNELIAQMLKTMPQSQSNTSRSGSRISQGFGTDRFNDMFSPPKFFRAPPPFVRNGRGSPRILEKLESEEDQVVLELLDGLKEEMGLCRTDVELLEWAKEKVFSPNPKYTSLISDQSPSTSTTTATNEDGSSANNSISPTTASTDDDDIGGPTFSPVYPRILAHLLGYIRRNFNNPHLVLALFHYAQTSSPESYLSGCLAPAYNEVIRTRWESFKDLEGVEAAIKEMEANGVAWDKGTAKTITKIVDEVGKDVWKGTGWQEKYGKDVHVRLAKLEERLQKDINEENKMFEAKMREKANLRLKAARADQTREMYAAQDDERRDANAQ